MQPSPYGSVSPYGGLRPLGVGEILDNAIQVYRKNFVALVTMTAVAVVPIQIVSVLVNLSARPSSRSDTETFGGIHVRVGQHRRPRCRGAVGCGTRRDRPFVVAGRLAIGACTRGVADAYLGGARPTRARRCASPFARSGRCCGSSCSRSRRSSSASRSASCPASGCGSSWLVATPGPARRGRAGTDALRRSYELVRPRFWPTLGLGVVAVLLTMVVSFSLNLLLVGVIFSTHEHRPSTAYIVAAGALATVSSLITTPLVASAYVILYFDLRVRHEGLDLQLVLVEPRQPQAPVDAPTPSFVPSPLGRAGWADRRTGRRHRRRSRRHPPVAAASATTATTAAAAADHTVMLAATSIPHAHARRGAPTSSPGRRYKGAPVPRPLHGVLRWIGDRFSPIGRWIGDRFSWLPDAAQPWLGAAVLIVARDRRSACSCAACWRRRAQSRDATRLRRRRRRTSRRARRRSRVARGRRRRGRGTRRPRARGAVALPRRSAAPRPRCARDQLPAVDPDRRCPRRARVAHASTISPTRSRASPTAAPSAEPSDTDEAKPRLAPRRAGGAPAMSSVDPLEIARGARTERRWRRLPLGRTDRHRHRLRGCRDQPVGAVRTGVDRWQRDTGRPALVGVRNRRRRPRRIRGAARSRGPPRRAHPRSDLATARSIPATTFVVLDPEVFSEDDAGALLNVRRQRRPTRDRRQVARRTSRRRATSRPSGSRQARPGGRQIDPSLAPITRVVTAGDGTLLQHRRDEP